MHTRTHTHAHTHLKSEMLEQIISFALLNAFVYTHVCIGVYLILYDTNSYESGYESRTHVSQHMCTGVYVHVHVWGGLGQ